ncbi:MAG: hypothetical protein WKF89_04975 [Chitinophagaceae bacterium]
MKQRLQPKVMMILTCITWYGHAGYSQNFAINGNWKVNFEDHKEFSRADLNDAEWAELPGLNRSDDHKTTANRVLWIRKKVVIPSSLKRALEESGLLPLSLGKILQSDDTFLNGKLIGSTGSGDSYRNYLVSKEDILWDKENHLSIRVMHWGSFRVSKLPELVAASPSHFLAYSSGIKNGDLKSQVNNKGIVYQLTVINRSPKSMGGLVRADFYNFEGSLIHSDQKKVTVAAGTNTINFPYRSASAFIKIVYSLTADGHHTSSNGMVNSDMKSGV